MTAVLPWWQRGAAPTCRFIRQYGYHSIAIAVPSSSRRFGGKGN